MTSSQEYRKLGNRSWTERTFSKLETGGLRSSILTLSSSAMGAGLLSLPFAISQSGLFLGVFFLCVGGLAFKVFYQEIVEGCELEGIYDYVKLMEKLYGETGRRLTELTIVIGCFGAVTAFIVLVGEMFGSISVSIGSVRPEDVQVASNAIIVFLAVLVWFPLSFPRELTALGYFSFLSIIAISLITTIVVADTPRYILENGAFSDELVLLQVNSSVFGTLSITVFALSAVQNVPIVYSELKGRSRKRMSVVINRSLLLVMVLYCTLGVLGYLSYVGNVPEVIVFRPTFDGSSIYEDWSMVVSRGMVGVYLTVAVPLVSYGLRRSLEQFLFGSTLLENNVRRLCIAACVLALSSTLAILVPSAITFITLMGSIPGSTISFIIPSMITYKTSRSKLKTGLLIATSSTFFILGILTSIIEVVKLMG